MFRMSPFIPLGLLFIMCVAGDSTSYEGSEDGTGLDSPLHSFVVSLTLSILSELGDKTFIIAALLAMSNPRLSVFAGAFCSLIIMTILSAILGHSVTALIPKSFTSSLAGLLFLVFAFKLSREARKMRGEEIMEEIHEVELELQGRESSDLEHGVQVSLSSDSSSKIWIFNRVAESLRNLADILFSPVFVQAFIMTFLGEWGDRSQIATIAMAAGQDYYWVIMGTVCGHGLCTSIAVLGGRLVASKISVRTGSFQFLKQVTHELVTMGGAVMFALFGIIYLYDGFSL
ncbi:GCR1-dependent translation factor 1 [Neolecta irregularis DAH-3]|uniref:GDT1 family protein n=1 Tax=Neolecta irregularis (strain DAH-3) TaxID=1198029 RepID=A0A1U7LU86_NEOID|nr:GCR1-dependent translation factor 1 [Neolecta irregularis DAH-3]|eukprot:OLL26227.1 GCR1-dependent translation factor 1 [Neolecta irregularis DAH-3]